MTREEQIDWLCRLRGRLGITPAPKEWRDNCKQALSEAIKALEQEPCEDAIDRAKLLQRSVISVPFHMSDGSVDYVDMVFAADICRAKPVTPQPKTGRWTRELVRNDYGGCIGAKMICSECGQDNGCDKRMKFCPNCGCRMVEPQESE